MYVNQKKQRQPCNYLIKAANIKITAKFKFPCNCITHNNLGSGIPVYIKLRYE